MNNLEVSVAKWTRGTVMGGFSLNSGYYAGRGPTYSDLPTATLEGIYNGLKEDVGSEAATNFVRFVNSLTDMSASSFIMAFLRFAASGFSKPKAVECSGDRDEPNSRIGAAAVVLDRLSGRSGGDEENIRRQSKSLKREFLEAHRDEIPVDEREEELA